MFSLLGAQDALNSRYLYIQYGYCSAMSGDHLDGSVALEAVITETGVKAVTKSRAVAAIDRLIGSLVDWPTSIFEAKARTVRLEAALADEAAAMRAKIRNEIDGEFQRLEAYAELERRRSAIQDQINREAVVAEALSDLRSDKDSETSSEEKINDDWISEFSRYASYASTDYARLLWGKVLSGQIKGGDFSKSTLRTISELDEKTASLFVEFIKMCLDSNYVIVGLDGLSGHNLMNAVALEAAGLVYGVSAPLSMKFDTDKVFVQKSNDYMLVGDLIKPVNIQFMPLTINGAEIRKIADESDGLDAIRNLAKLVKDSCSKLEIHRIVGPAGPNSFQTKLFETIVEGVS